MSEGPKDPFHPQNMFQKLKLLSNAANMPLLETNPVNAQVHLRANTEISRGMFKPDPLVPGGYVAHPITIRAVRKEIFMAGEGFEDLEQWIVCESCKTRLDKQFWHFCPYCEAQFPRG